MIRPLIEVESIEAVLTVMEHFTSTSVAGGIPLYYYTLISFSPWTILPDKKSNRVKDCCVVCKVGKHPLHACKSAQAFSHREEVTIFREE